MMNRPLPPLVYFCTFLSVFLVLCLNVFLAKQDTTNKKYSRNTQLLGDMQYTYNEIMVHQHPLNKYIACP